jgi:hypothetical protein
MWRIALGVRAQMKAKETPKNYLILALVIVTPNR